MQRRLVLLSSLLTAGVLVVWLLMGRGPADQDSLSTTQTQASGPADTHLAPGPATVQTPSPEPTKASTAPRPASTSGKPTPNADASQAIDKQMPASPQKQPKIITFGRCTTKSGYLMANDEQVMAKAILLQSRRDLGGLKELQAAGLVLDLPARVEVCFYDVNPEGSLAKILLPGQEIIFWTSYAALECNL